MEKRKRTKAMNKIELIKIRRIFDPNADTSFIGDYTDNKDDWNICCHCGQYIHNAEIYNRVFDIVDSDIDYFVFKLGETEENFGFDSEEYKRFEKIYNAFEIVLKKFQDKKHDCPISHKNYNYFKPYASGERVGTKYYQEYGLRDFERMESYNNESWHFLGIIAEAIVNNQKFKSPGCWGIESDSEEMQDDIAKQQLHELKRILSDFQVDLSNWDELTENLEMDDIEY